MNLFDLHCDTPYRCYMEKKELFQNDFHVSVKSADYIEKWIQCMAVWMPDEIRGERATQFFENVSDNLLSQKKIPSILTQKDTLQTAENIFILTVEGGSALGGRLENVSKLAQKGVKMLTLTWNSENELGGGADTDLGLTHFGRDAIRELEKNRIIIDVSHACDRLFYDVAEFRQRPIVASHSNSRSVCPHRRNLTDEQFKIIKDKGGIVGINFCKSFLRESGEASIDDIYRHTDHFLSLGGENTLAIGSDFDGTDLPQGISGIKDIYKVYEYLLMKNYPQGLVDKIFFDNAFNFFSTNL